MALMPPDELTVVLRLVDFVWPEANEDKLWDEAAAWLDQAERFRTIAETADDAARGALRDSQGPAMDAFEEHWRTYGDENGYLPNSALAGDAMGYALLAAGIIVLVLKIAVIIQLVVLAAIWAVAYATSALTLGASLAYAWSVTATVRTTISSMVSATVAALNALGPELLDFAEEAVGGVIARLRTDKAGLPWNEGRDPALNYRYLDPELIAELEQLGIKFNHDEMVAIGRGPNGQIIFLEKGNVKSGLRHIIRRHGKEYEQRGIPQDQIPMWL